MKRVCGSLLTQREPVPHYAVVAAATNHRQMFDRATWRCFEVRPELRSPDDARLHLYIRGGLTPSAPMRARTRANCPECSRSAVNAEAATASAICCGGGSWTRNGTRTN